MKNKQISIGDYVLATKYSDGDPQDQWAVGFISDIRGERYFVVDSQKELFRASGFRMARKITEQEGEWLLSNKDDLERSIFSLWNWLSHIREVKYKLTKR